MIALYRAFLNSCAGIAHGIRTERAIRQEAALLVIGVPVALWITPAAGERLALILALLAVLCVEFLNTAIEKLCDHVTPEQHPAIKAIKDMGSAACFCAQAGCGLVWLLVLWGRVSG